MWAVRRLEPATARFCGGCGSPLALVSSSCDAELYGSAALLRPVWRRARPRPAPPSPIHAPPPRPSGAVRKTVTVLFADLGGSTSFGERTDAEVARTVMAHYHAVLQQAIDDHAGTVAKFMGDGMMATFGIPEVAEDDARRAVAAGSTPNAASRVRGRCRAAPRRDPHAAHRDQHRRGGDRRGDADLVGDALNVAARLEKACRPGRVLVGEETWRLTRGDVRLRCARRGDRRRSGATGRDLRGGGDAEETPSRDAVRRAGRARWLRLVAVFADARGRAARLVTVLGSPGVGKTRLSRELRASPRRDPRAPDLEIRCDRSGERHVRARRPAHPGGGRRSATRPTTASVALTHRPAARRRRRPGTACVDALAGLVGAGRPARWRRRSGPSAAGRVARGRAPADGRDRRHPVGRAAAARPARAPRRVGGRRRGLVVGLARPELRDVRPAFAEPGRPVAEVLALDGLDSSATEALAAGLLGTERLPPDLVDRLPASTDGNPLFVRELVRMLVDDGVIRRGDDGPGS